MSGSADARRELRVADFDFDLPQELIAQQPPAERGSSRMLVMDRASGAVRDAAFADLPSLLKPGDLLVLNDSRVIPARLFARRVSGRPASFPTLFAPSNEGAEKMGHPLSLPTLSAKNAERMGHGNEPAGRIEVLLTEPAGESRWRALVKPGRKVGIGDRLAFSGADGEIELEAEVLERGEYGERLLEFAPVHDFFAILERIGHVPLPPYIRRGDLVGDRERYQTVYSRERGSVAAPTAGLHFTPIVLNALALRGVEIARITLHVGLGTFAPVRVERVDQVHLHSERYSISAEAAEAVNRARRERRRIVAVGTTAVRTLEAAALQAAEGDIIAHSGTTDIFISPGFEFRVTGALLTNFHLPQSSLLMLVSAFAGRKRVLAAYRHAVDQRYRFYSYGDCMLIA
ncbi:MAG TPA: tRNA preQ1(34) S-adenosylmethionine ribosyltransferase-isomerase QueA [Terracidiphilus sp.]|nr:tRNA preQ1(34) S-adenosylmethionine ribosyltransferase-isomerase QueA [Terracidiphilus sp.]